MALITEYLAADHGRLDALLTEAVLGAEFDANAYSTFRAVLLRHIAIEEKVLFSAVRKLTGALSLDELHRLRIEHAALTSLLVPTPDRTLVAEIVSLLVQHNAREEGADGVYARCEAALGAFSTSLEERARAYPRVPMMRHFDGAGALRTAKEALRSAERLRTPREQAR
jgi:hypothetical protein